MKSALPMLIAGRYRHYKGCTYVVLAEAEHSETHERLVVYCSTDENGSPLMHQLWVRPLAMFTESVFHRGAMVPRFALIEEPAPSERPSRRMEAGIPSLLATTEGTR
jgi:hypothetical protein